MGESAFPTESGPPPGDGERDLAPPRPSGPGGVSGQPEKSGGITAIGVMNLLFGFLCGCGGIGLTILMFSLPAMFDQFSQAIGTAIQQDIDRMSARIAAEEEIEQDALAAGDQETADAARAEIVRMEKSLQKIQDVNPTRMFDSMTEMFDAPGMKAYNGLNAAVMLFGNLFWIISGFAILRRREWGRTLAVVTAGGKILAEIVLAVIAIVYMPSIMEEYFAGMQDMLKHLDPNSAEAAQLQQMQNMGPQMIIQSIIGTLMWSVYPVVVLIVMLQSKTREEFREWTGYYERGGV